MNNFKNKFMILNRRDVVDWGRINSLRKKEMIVFLECLRNINENNDDELLIGYPSKFRFLKEGGFLECVSETERRRYMCYYKLTDKGYKVLNQLKNITLSESDYFEIYSLFSNLNKV